MNKREHNVRIRSVRRAIFPIRLRRDSRWQESSNRERPSKKSPPPKLSRPQRRFDVSIKSTARSGARGIRVFSSNAPQDRKSTRLNSSHSQISYAVFCLKKKK